MWQAILPPAEEEVCCLRVSSCQKKTHCLCPRCGKRSYHQQKKKCAACGYPAAKIRSYEWSKKSKRRRAPGTGRMQYVKHVARRFKNGFREGGTQPARKKGAAGK